MAPIARFPPNKELEVALAVAETVLHQKDGYFRVVPAGVNFGVNHTIVANLIRGGENGQSTLICDKKVAEGIKKTGLIFSEPGIVDSPEPKNETDNVSEYLGHA